MELFGYSYDRKTRKYQRKNFELESIISKLIKKSEETKIALYKAVAENLKKPRRAKVQINVGKISKLTEKGDFVVVPGKILSMGSIDHKVTIVCHRISNSAKEQLEAQGCKVLSLEEFLDLDKSKIKGAKILR